MKRLAPRSLEEQFQNILTRLYEKVAEAKAFEHRLDEKNQIIFIKFVGMLNKILEDEINYFRLQSINYWLTQKNLKSIYKDFANHWTSIFETYERYLTFLLETDRGRAESFLARLRILYNNRNWVIEPPILIKDRMHRQIHTRKFTIPLRN